MAVPDLVKVHSWRRTIQRHARYPIADSLRIHLRRVRSNRRQTESPAKWAERTTKLGRKRPSIRIDNHAS